MHYAALQRAHHAGKRAAQRHAVSWRAAGRIRGAARAFGGRQSLARTTPRTGARHGRIGALPARRRFRGNDSRVRARAARHTVVSGTHRRGAAVWRLGEDSDRAPDRCGRHIRRAPLPEAGGCVSRGRLKVYLGYAAGVGKTYRMLEEAQEMRRQGVDIVIGYFEPHGRLETIAKTEGLEAIPRRKVAYGGSQFEEMDTE